MLTQIRMRGLSAVAVVVLGLLLARVTACDGDSYPACPDGQVLIDGRCIPLANHDDDETPFRCLECPVGEVCGPGTAVEWIKDDGGVPTEQFRCVPTDGGVP